VGRDAENTAFVLTAARAGWGVGSMVGAKTGKTGPAWWVWATRQDEGGVDRSLRTREMGREVVWGEGG